MIFCLLEMILLKQSCCRLWDHLSSNLHLYVQPQEPFPDEVVRTSSVPNQLLGRHNSQQECLTGSVQTNSEYERENSTKVSRSRHNREWKGLVREDTEAFPLRSIVTEIVHSEEKTHRRTNLDRRSHSPEPQVHRKQSSEDGRQQNKVSHASFLLHGWNICMFDLSITNIWSYDIC